MILLYWKGRTFLACTALCTAQRAERRVLAGAVPLGPIPLPAASGCLAGRESMTEPGASLFSMTFGNGFQIHLVLLAPKTCKPATLQDNGYGRADPVLATRAACTVRKARPLPPISQEGAGLPPHLRTPSAAMSGSSAGRASIQLEPSTFSTPSGNTTSQ